MKREIILFLIVGAFSTVINYLTFVLLVYFDTNRLFASASGYVCGLVIGYFLNKNYSFDTKSSSHKLFYSYLFVYLLNLVISLAILKILISFSLNIYIANFLVICYTTMANFIGLKLKVFKSGI